MNDNECRVQTSPVYEGQTEDGTITIEEVYTPGGTGSIDDGVAITVADLVLAEDDSETAALIVVDPEQALEIAAGLTRAAHCAMWRREMGW